MITIKFLNIHINTASDRSGVLIGNNFAANWDMFTKSNTNSSGDHATNCVNIIVDNDGYDFIADDHDSAQQVFGNEENKSKQKKDEE
ncbi:hypothetical protein P9E76_19020 [Schinkia azotoformans]|uniref:Uncharacterized protein n=1 Tax=Schinkia azotoformans LMG 9581 TaxID=1131731 RepID=K6DGL2_SCHAZ|nr:hypothetical protein [Schinkia azotoformans]EKN67228.1 hypothetical protein BAZO_09891 [Schinkia azotoformans LMG 9581]MEC1639933.1 hypothetical protein [Schinkia azotoformans]MEC1722940.1 hypothetical protein [Schinkia azotoformans]MEC1947098.1 hypothetical protein [Schinkia azotoformans]MED4352881.1 hypothetical protein [Schinkia azotoformans]